jgi:hypothetical protein
LPQVWVANSSWSFPRHDVSLRTSLLIFLDYI